MIWRRVWRSLLQSPPDGITNFLLFSPQMRIPKPDDPHSMRLQPLVPFRIRRPIGRHPVLKTVHLDVQASLEAKEV
jgi:hypothetical protein